MDRVHFLGIEDEAPDLILSFALYDEDLGVKSLILQRTPEYEAIFPEHERGVKVSMEGDEDYEFNLLEKILIENGVVRITALRGEYEVDISRIDQEEFNEMLEIIKKLNFDSRFEVRVI